jgi:hypothetical protein
LIPLRSTPFIKIEAILAETEVKGVAKMKTLTSPELELIHNDLFKVIRNMHDSLQETERVDKIIFPLLQVE